MRQGVKMGDILKPEIFREYDIRGKVSPEELSEENVLKIGKAIGTYLARMGKRKVVVAHDCRESSKPFSDSLIKGISSSGCDVLNAGLCPTPALYYSIINENADAGCMITGSHIPPEYNGIKISLGTLSIHGKEIQKIRKIAEDLDFEEGKGIVEAISPMQAYSDELEKRIGKLKRSLKVAFDYGNGMACMVVPKIAEKLNIEAVHLFNELDGRFSNHLPDSSSKKNLSALIEEMKEGDFDIGIAFDGDADRFSIVDRKGNLVLGDAMLVFFFDDIRKKREIKKAITDIKCSQSVIDKIEEMGGKVILSRTGHSIIEEVMENENALLATELSGHVFLRDEYYGFDDAIYAALRFLRYLSESEKPFDEIYGSLPKYFTSPEYRLECPEDKKFSVVLEIKKMFENDYETITIDGVRAKVFDGWFLVRASNTQAQISMRFESRTKEGYEKIKGLLRETLQKFPYVEQGIA